MPLEQTHVGPKNRVLNEGSDSPTRKGTFGGHVLTQSQLNLNMVIRSCTRMQVRTDV